MIDYKRYYDSQVPSDAIGQQITYLAEEIYGDRPVPRDSSYRARHPYGTLYDASEAPTDWTGLWKFLTRPFPK